MEGEAITVLWDEAPSNGATVTYTVTISLDGQQVLTRTTEASSVLVTRKELQEEADAVQESSYQVRVTTENSAGTGGEATATITIPSGTAANFCICVIFSLYFSSAGISE